MKTIGIDLSVDEAKTAAATISWGETTALVESVECGIDNDRLLELLERSDPRGIDSPLGWPEAMARAVAAHSAGRPWPAPCKEEFRYRRTDHFVVEQTRDPETGKNATRPLSVAADRIAMPAWRIASIRAKSKSPGFRLDGRDGVYEVYPAAALRIWGLPYKGYKEKKGIPIRGEILEGIKGQASWLEWSPGTEEECLRRDHSLDAVVSALIVRVASTDRTLTPPPGDEAAAETEGWIHLPAPGVSLDDLIRDE
jgi:hypothetical protein